MNEINVKQGSKEWLDERIGKVSGSRCGAILGHSPFNNQDDVLREMVRAFHGAESEFTGNIATDHGLECEGVGRIDYTVKTKNKVTEHGMWVDDWLSYSPDGVINNNILLEIKSPFSRKIPEIPPQHYVDQVQLGMFISGLKMCHLWYWTEEETRLFEIPFDPAWVDENLPKLKEFYQRYVSELDNAAHLEPLVAHREDEQWVSAVGLYRAAEAHYKAAELELKEAKDNLVSLCNERDSEGAGVEVKKITRRGNVQYAKILALKDIDLDQYRGKDSTYWKVSVRGEP